MAQVTGNRLLDGLSAPALARVRIGMDLVQLEPKAFVVPAYEQLKYVYFPTKGLVSLFVLARGGQGVQAASVGQDGMLGMSAVLQANVPPFEMICLVGGIALRLPTNEFERLLRDVPEFASRTRRYTHGLFNETVRTAGCNGIHTVDQRLARCLLLARDRLNRDAFPLTHEDLAHMLGATRPFVTRTVASLASHGVIRHERGLMHLIDIPGLEGHACEDYGCIQAEYARLLS